MSDPKQPSVHHRALSTTFQGIQRKVKGGPDVWQFRGIKYGVIPARFIQASLNEKFPETTNATSFGPKAPQTVVPVSLENALIGKPPKNQPQHAENIFDEFECLNLNITAPAGAKAGSDYPVMVYIHGGGGFAGSSSDWYCDGAGLVSKGVEIGKPIVHVTMSYRLTALGHLGSSEMREVNGDINGGNFAYHDIRLAMKWVQNHISPFGGSSSPSKTTLYGESFGSLATESLLHSLLPNFFTRCILQSQVLGAAVFSEPEDIATKSAVYTKTKEMLAVNSLKELQDVPWQDLLKAFAAADPRAGIAHVPMIDGVFIGEGWRKNFQIPGESADGERKGAVMLGNTTAEALVVEVILNGYPTPEAPPLTSALISSLYSLVPGDEGKMTPFLEAYEIKDSTPLPVLKKNLYDFVEDSMWYSPTQELASLVQESGTTKLYQFAFDQPNAFESPVKGAAHHAIDLVYLHGDSSVFEGVEHEDEEVAFQAKLRELWIGFAHGEDVWESNAEMKKIFMLGPKGRTEQKDIGAFLEESGSNRWRTFEALEFGVMGMVVFTVMGHLAGMSGV